MNLPAISTANVSAPSQSSAAKPAAQPFNHVLGSLITSGEKSSAQTNPKKQQSEQDPLTVQFPVATAQPPQPVILPTALKLHVLLPASSKGDSNKSEEGDGTDGEASTTSSAQGLFLLPQLAAVHVTPQSTVPAARVSASAGEMLLSQGSKASLLDPLNLSLSDSKNSRLALKTDEVTPLPKSELAFSAKITPLATPVSGHANASSAPSASAVADPEPPSVPAAGDNQQADTNANSDSGQTPRQALKSQAKIQSEATLQTGDPAPAVSNPYSAQVTVPTGLTPAPAPNGPAAVTKHEAEPATQPLDARPAAAALSDTAAASKSEPVRDLSIRIGNNPGNQVDVKIQERAGEVHVSVLSSSPTLTSDLRQQVGDLVGKLDRAGYHAETFKPASSTASQQSSNQSDQGQERDSSGGRQRQQQQETTQQQLLLRQKRSNQTQWLQQLNGSFGPTAN